MLNPACDSPREKEWLALHISGPTDAGDQVSRKGAMTGGYRDQNRSRLGAMQKLKHAREKLDGLEEKSDKIKAQLSSMDQSITIVSGEVEKLELKRKQDVETYKSLKVCADLPGGSCLDILRLAWIQSLLTKQIGSL